MQAIGYIRVSTDAQATEGVSLAVQRGRIRAWAASRGTKLVAIHADEGISGKRADNRPGLQAALADACRANGVLVAYDLTRLARSTRDAIDIADRLRRAGAQLCLTSGDIDTTTPSGEFVFTLFAALGQLERRQTAERTRLALAHKRANGERYTRVAPYGYRWRDGRVVSVPKERRTVALMQRLRADGWSYVRIAAELDRRAIKARCRRKWNWSSVRAAPRIMMRETEAAKVNVPPSSRCTWAK